MVEQPSATDAARQSQQRRELGEIKVIRKTRVRRVRIFASMKMAF
jgi:hypothetical protein